MPGPVTYVKTDGLEHFYNFMLTNFVYLNLWLCGGVLNRGSYMSAHVLLNLLIKLGKRDKMQGLPSILSLFPNEVNKFNNKRARIIDSIHHMTLRLL